MPHTIYAILGATGHVGGLAASKLLDKGKKVRVVGRNAGKLKALGDRGAEVAIADVQDAKALAKAFAGADAAFVLVPPNFQTPSFRTYQRNVVSALAASLEAAGIGNVITLSSVGADRPDQNGPVAGLYEMEQRLNRLAGNVLHLRPGFFMENNLMSIGMVKGMGMLGSATRGDVALPMIATRDIGEVVARRLAAGDFSGKQVQDLLGARDVTMSEVASALGKAIGRADLKYVQFPYEDARKGLVQMGVPEEMAGLYVELSKGFNEGAVKATQARSAMTTTPTTIETFAEQVFAPAYRAS
ncbi:MAG TPA: NAD(P)H-binding protein [Anaeromyxobacteraceae bacterium]|nr:NAD(P)H-binding protein [Anaeromyxobacteraceae bacterium]